VGVVSSISLRCRLPVPRPRVASQGTPPMFQLFGPASPRASPSGNEAFEDLADPRGDPFQRPGTGSLLVRRPVVRAPEQKPARGGVRWGRDLVDETAEPGRPDDPRAHPQVAAR